MGTLEGTGAAGGDTTTLDDKEAAPAVPSPTEPGWDVYSEGWDPAYGASADFDPGDDDVGVEQAEPGDGHVLAGTARAVPIAFVDGTRRAELLVWAEHAATGTRIPGLAGAYAVGAVCIRPGSPAEFAGVRVGRLAVWGGGHTGDIVSPLGFRWTSAPITGTEPELCLAHLQDRMRRAEGELALDAAALGWNVVLDGPLNRIRALHGLVAGYVKSHHRRILPMDAHVQIPALAVGARTRVFTAGTDRYTCYIRVGHPPPGASPWAGIARLEFPAVAGIVAVTGRASELAALLPRYAGVAHRDERAPVNLTPVRNLEVRLAKTLGRVSYATRAARDALITGAAR